MEKPTLCIVGLGYVGLPLAHVFAKNDYEVIGYDINAKRIDDLTQGVDYTNELTTQQLQEVTIEYTNDATNISRADIVIIAVPTPIDADNNPDIQILKSATKTAGQHIKKGAIVVFESTVYPGTTEEICGPILEEESGMKCGEDFTLGYSPERVNPGDKEHTIDKIVKVVSGQNDGTLKRLMDLYGSIIAAGVHAAPNIKVAEMAKAIENAQRDLNIAFVNEIAQLSNKVGIGTKDVLKAAGTKWNFLPFEPGLVGGHCIGVDPYYLVEKARQLGMETHVITAGRSVNDSMGAFVANQITSNLSNPETARVLVLGVTFKQNVPDTRNSKVKDVVQSLEESGCIVHAFDPFYSDDEITSFGFTPGSLADGPYDAVAVLVPHKEYAETGVGTFTSLLAEGGVLYDLKGIVDKDTIQESGREYVSL